MSQYLQVTEQDTHMLWCLSRPTRGNALGVTLAQELETALHELQRVPREGKILVVTATPLETPGDRTWIAGGDLKELAPLSRAEAAEYSQRLARICTGLERLPMIVAMAIDGAAIGGGAELALASDLRVATRASRFEFKQLRVGLAAGYGSTRRLVELLGKSRAQGLMFLGGSLSAEEALALGLLHAVVPDGPALEAHWQELARSSSLIAPRAIAAQKAMFHHQSTSHPGSVTTMELELFRELWGNAHHGRFLAEFLGKRGASSEGKETKGD